MTQKYKMLEDSELEARAAKGIIVYQFAGHDYGLAADDSRITGKPHISVTLNRDGSIPSFTVPEKDIEAIENDPPVEADFYKCGAGRGHECCAYLLGGAKGAECGREQTIKTHIENRVAAKDMNARRLPTEPWPECMKFSAQLETVTKSEIGGGIKW